MARFSEIPKEPVQQEVKRKPGLRGCDVYGCNRPGHIFDGNFNCRWHYRRAGKNLGRITHNLNMHVAEIDWLEKLLTFSIVDYDVKEVHKRAPQGMLPEESETFQQYKLRMNQFGQDLIYGETHHLSIKDRAAGEKEE